jgi:hypothetical protein
MLIVCISGDVQDLHQRFQLLVTELSRAKSTWRFEQVNRKSGISMPRTAGQHLKTCTLLIEL